MASKPSKTTPTSTIVRPDQISQPQSIPTVQQNLNVKPTKPIPIPKSAHTSVAHASVTDATKLTYASPTSRKMFFEEVARKCYEIASPRRKRRGEASSCTQKTNHPISEATEYFYKQMTNKEGYHKLQPQMQDQPIP